MTIDELLETACYWITEAVAAQTPMDEAAQCAQIAQAAAQTAQAMIMHAQHQDIAASNERAELQALWRQ